MIVAVCDQLLCLIMTLKDGEVVTIRLYRSTEYRAAVTT
jgi:hypothetical protein